MPACKHDASAFLFLRWLKSLCLKYNNTCALQIIAQIVYFAGIDTDNSWSENVVLTVFYNSCLFTIAKLYNYCQPVIASSVAVMWGMDHFGWMKALSVLLVFTGVLLVTGTGGKRTVQEQ